MLWCVHKSFESLSEQKFFFLSRPGSGHGEEESATGEEHNEEILGSWPVSDSSSWMCLRFLLGPGRGMQEFEYVRRTCDLGGTL